MTTDIRAQVVEAMAQAMYLLDWPDGWVENAEAGIINQHVWRDQAEAALDAALDVLGTVAKPVFVMGGLSPALYHADPETDEVDHWIIDIQALRAGKGSE